MNADSTKTPKVGGEYGAIRAGAALDVENLHAYLSQHAPKIILPVGVKQFKVNPSTTRSILMTNLKICFVVWAGKTNVGTPHTRLVEALRFT